MDLRRSLALPPPIAFDAAIQLASAVEAHISGNFGKAERLFASADHPEVRAYTESVWGAGAKGRFAFRSIVDAPPHLARSDRPTPRMPTTAVRRQVVERDGYHCRFCGIPVIAATVRRSIQMTYPNAVRWGSSNIAQHAAFQCMWLQFDHVLPNGRGGLSDFENIVVTCAPCNFGRMETTLEEASLIDPRGLPLPTFWAGFHEWDGLSKFVN